jgi:hypothetical protein
MSVKIPQGPIIIIDDYQFMLTAKQEIDTYKHIGFMSAKIGEVFTNPLTQGFVSYKSNSEGFWRLAMRNYPGASFEKGKDYVTASFIDLRLQKFFEENYDKLPSLPFMAAYNTKRAVTVMNEFKNQNNKNNPNDDRLFFDPVFDCIHSSCAPPYSETCIVKPSIFLNFITPRPSPMFGGPGMPRSRSSSPTPVFSLTPEQQAIENEMKRKIAVRAPIIQEQNKLHLECKKELTRIANEVFADKIANYKEKSKTMRKYENITGKEMLEFFSKFVEYYFEVDTSVQDFLFTMPLYMVGGEKGTGKNSESFNLDIYLTKIRNKLTNQEYNLYYSHFIRKGIEYKNMINIVPIQGVKITMNGLYSKYVTASPYIYKLFDYLHQCNFSMMENGSCGKYTFIGNIYNNLWPLPLLKRLKGGSKRKHKIMTRKNKKRYSRRK